MHYLTHKELLALFSDSKLTPRQRLMFKVAFWHGLRVSELIGLQNKVHIVDGHIDVQRLKGSLRTVHPFQKHEDPLLDEATELAELERTLPPGDRLFPVTRFAVYKLMRSVCVRQGIPKHKAHPHILKHTIVHMTIRTAGIENVRQYVGHRSIASTGAYLRVTDEAASLAVTRALS